MVVTVLHAGGPVEEGDPSVGSTPEFSRTVPFLTFHACEEHRVG